MTTQAPELVKLTGAGNSLALDVSSAAQVPVGKYPEIEFVGLDANRRLLALRVPKASAERQLGRANLTYPDVVGKRVLFSRDPNPNDPAKAYWGLTVLEEVSGAKGNGTSGAQPAPRQAVATTAASEVTQPVTTQPAAQNSEAPAHPSGAALYRKIAKWYLDEIVPLYVEAGVPVTHEGCGAGIAALYIQANKH